MSSPRASFQRHIPIQHGQGLAQGRLPAAPPHTGETSDPLPWRDGSQQGSPLALGDQEHLQLHWAPAGSRDGHRQPERATSPRITGLPRELAWQTASRATGTLPSLAHPYARSKGRAWESIHGQGRGQHCRKCPAELQAQTSRFVKHYLIGTGIIKLPALPENFQSLVTAGFFKIPGTGTRGTTVYFSLLLAGHISEHRLLKPQGLVHQKLYLHHTPGSEGGHALRVLSSPCHSPK